MCSWNVEFKYLARLERNYDFVLNFTLVDHNIILFQVSVCYMQLITTGLYKRSGPYVDLKLSE